MIYFSGPTGWIGGHEPAFFSPLPTVSPPTSAPCHTTEASTAVPTMEALPVTRQLTSEPHGIPPPPPPAAEKIPAETPERAGSNGRHAPTAAPPQFALSATSASCLPAAAAGPFTALQTEKPPAAESGNEPRGGGGGKFGKTESKKLETMTPPDSGSKDGSPLPQNDDSNIGKGRKLPSFCRITN